ncbi:peroxide stress protein YaaA [Flavicella sp.]|uniref:peroxide stress protein YaaA n=1 Tax=Flavicella sp. TaxID=2957742 RepID=UPI00261DA2A9|nr:peroxide stress protein YaaA [Flavicella sp.]MDG1803732.1 peroxide stress protein YaaA [Flavicella sp.]
MKIVISPAKSLDLDSVIPTNSFSQPQFLEESEKLSKVLKKKSPKKIGELMSISAKLSELNWQRNQDWELPFTTENARQAVYAFKGDVYIGLDAYTIEDNKLEQLNDKLRILSGLYGVLKPFDLIQAYRLEMGTKLKVGTKDNLYQFWENKITDALNAEMEEGELLVNLASNEYYKVVKPKLIENTIVTPQFKDYKDGKLKMISFFAKKARGMMVRYIIDNNIKDIEGLKGFNSDGYGFSEELSSENELMFVR